MFYRFAVCFYALAWCVFAGFPLVALLGKLTIGPQYILPYPFETYTLALLFFVPLVLVIKRWRICRRRQEPLLPDEFLRTRRLGRRLGVALLWLGNILVLLVGLGIVVGLAGGGEAGFATIAVPSSALAMAAYALAVLTIEVSVHRWATVRAA